ncbi:MAG TPA: hypothetical protein DEA96_01130 [Leptospiraceae bacterium]|nr:hypothetical protein [Spirochaetaceae bacterium]HBS03536.1 hypothetical protein [Leptospiraceae bacterium]
MRRFVYSSTGPLIAAAVVFRLVFCPAGLCANTMPGSSGAEETGTVHVGMEMEKASDASPCHGSKESENSMPSHAPGSEHSGSSASCCNNETVNRAPATPVLAEPVLLAEALPLPNLYSALRPVLISNVTIEKMRPPDSVRLHVQNQQFLN